VVIRAKSSRTVAANAASPRSNVGGHEKLPTGGHENAQ
jgi:hypothetical protein